MLLTKKTLLLLDEPTNHLDIPSREAVEEALRDFSGALIVVSHDRYLLERVPNRLLLLQPGVHRFVNGGYDSYLQASSQPAAAAAAPRKVAPALPAGKPRKQAPAGSPLKRLKELESRIHAAEERIAELARLLADPSTYRDGGAAGLTSEYETLNTKLEHLYAEWTEAGELANGQRV